MFRTTHTCIFAGLALALTTAPLAAQTPAKQAGPSTGNVAGTWVSVDKKTVLKIGPDGNGTLDAQLAPIQEDHVKWTSCHISGDNLTCAWSGAYHDVFKDIKRHGAVNAVLKGNVLSGAMSVEKVDSEHWRAPKYQSQAQKSSSFSFTRAH